MFFHSPGGRGAAYVLDGDNNRYDRLDDGTFKRQSDGKIFDEDGNPVDGTDNPDTQDRADDTDDAYEDAKQKADDHIHQKVDGGLNTPDQNASGQVHGEDKGAFFEPKSVDVENFRNLHYPDVANMLMNVSENISPGHKDGWHAVSEGILSDLDDFKTKLKTLEDAGGWKGETHDAAMKNLYLSYARPEIMARGAENMGIVTEYYSEIMSTTKHNILDQLDLYNDYLQKYPTHETETREFFDSFMRNCMGSIYTPEIKDVNDSLPGFVKLTPDKPSDNGGGDDGGSGDGSGDDSGSGDGAGDETDYQKGYQDGFDDGRDNDDSGNGGSGNGSDNGGSDIGGPDGGSSGDNGDDTSNTGGGNNQKSYTPPSLNMPPGTPPADPPTSNTPPADPPPVYTPPDLTTPPGSDPPASDTSSGTDTPGSYHPPGYQPGDVKKMSTSPPDPDLPDLKTPTPQDIAPGTRERAADLLRDPKVADLAKTLLSNPKAADLAKKLLEDPENSDLAEKLVDPKLAEPARKLLDDPQLADAARDVLGIPDSEIGDQHDDSDDEYDAGGDDDRYDLDRLLGDDGHLADNSRLAAGRLGGLGAGLSGGSSDAFSELIGGVFDGVNQIVQAAVQGAGGQPGGDQFAPADTLSADDIADHVAAEGVSHARGGGAAHAGVGATGGFTGRDLTPLGAPVAAAHEVGDPPGAQSPLSGPLGQGSGAPGGGMGGGGQRGGGSEARDHKVNKMLRGSSNGQSVIGESDAVLPVIGSDGTDFEPAGLPTWDLNL
ncbi:hypothetical protein [Mycolicibacterium smegmatis]|uniref:hypothetical protein n=1 Tax=Mycolicibacterium smegmatis TaxID=1772 RepID=UPI00130388D4|nr:hypothetical protein [Mycolicibacterium smegmatis]